jgi:NADH:ubiquinone oxidoreductase subunit H
MTIFEFLAKIILAESNRFNKQFRLHWFAFKDIKRLNNVFHVSALCRLQTTPHNLVWSENSLVYGHCATV